MDEKPQISLTDSIGGDGIYTDINVEMLIEYILAFLEKNRLSHPRGENERGFALVLMKALATKLGMKKNKLTGDEI